MPWAGGQKSRLKEMESVPPGGGGETCVFLPPAHPLCYLSSRVRTSPDHCLTKPTYTGCGLLLNIYR